MNHTLELIWIHVWKLDVLLGEIIYVVDLLKKKSKTSNGRRIKMYNM